MDAAFADAIGTMAELQRLRIAFGAWASTHSLGMSRLAASPAGRSVTELDLSTNPNMSAEDVLDVLKQPSMFPKVAHLILSGNEQIGEDEVESVIAAVLARTGILKTLRLVGTGVSLSDCDDIAAVLSDGAQ
jgi:hypothetical protein